jgi:hypothetical protein
MWFGAKIARWLGRGWLLACEVITALHAAVSGMLLKAFADIWPAILWPVAAVLLLAFVTYVSKSQAEQDRRDKEAALAAEAAAKQAARESEIAAICRNKRDATGNLARFLKTQIEQTNHTRTIQAHLLRNAVDVVKDYLQLPRDDDSIAATWVIPVDEYSKWKTVAYDKDRVHRQPGAKRDIKDGIPGAAQAFITGDRVLIPDVCDEKFARWFPATPAYRCILSVPARTMHMTCGANVTIGGNPNDRGRSKHRQYKAEPAH